MGFQKNGEVQLLLLWRSDMMREVRRHWKVLCRGDGVCQRLAFQNNEKQLSRHTYDAPNVNQDHNKLYKQEHGAFNQIKTIIIKAKSSDNINNCVVEMRDWCVCVCIYRRWL